MLPSSAYIISLSNSAGLCDGTGCFLVLVEEACDTSSAKGFAVMSKLALSIQMKFLSHEHIFFG